MKKRSLLILVVLLVAVIALAGVGTVTTTNNSTTRYLDKNFDTTVFTTETAIVPATNISRAENWTIWVKNTGASQAFSNLAILVSPVDADWDDAIDLVGSSLANVVISGCVDALAADTLCEIQCRACSFKFISVKITAADNATAEAWLQGRVSP